MQLKLNGIFFVLDFRWNFLSHMPTAIIRNHKDTGEEKIRGKKTKITPNEQKVIINKNRTSFQHFC